MSEEPPEADNGTSSPAPAAASYDSAHGLQIKRCNVGRVALLDLVIGYLVLEIFGVFFHLPPMPGWWDRPW